MQRIHIVGRKNSGKTTLIVELVRHLTAAGHRVGTIKHTHHRHELDVPGKDSFRHREAGAAAVGILTPGMHAAFWPVEPAADTAPRDARYDRFATLFADCDLVLVEGDQQTAAVRLEVWRPEVSEEPLARADSGIQAVITDAPLSGIRHVWPRSDLAALAQRLLQLAGSA